MSLSRIQPHLADRVRVTLAGPGELRIVLECALCDEILAWRPSQEKWYCSECDVSTSPLELAGIFQDCIDALGVQPPAIPEAPPPPQRTEEGLGERCRRVLLAEIQRRLRKED